MFGQDFFPFGFALILIIAIATLVVVYRSLRERNQTRLRELLHQERIAAMQHNQPVPEMPSHFDLPEGRVPTGFSVPTADLSLLWVRLTALGIGLFCVATGFGMVIGFQLVGDEEFQRMWGIGFLPIFAGLGLLLFYGLTASTARRLQERRRPASEPAGDRQE